MKVATAGWPKAHEVGCFFLARRTHSRALRSIALARCQIVQKKKKKKRKANKQPTNNKKKKEKENE